MTGIEARLARVRDSIHETLQAAGRRDAVTLVAVSKTVPATAVHEAYLAGQHVFGENRVQEALGKMEQLAAVAPGIHWHMVGHLQTNKVKSAVGRFALIESVGSLRLATEVNRRSALAEVRTPVLLEVNVGGEPTKSGFSPDEIVREAEAVLRLANLVTRGLMTVAPQVSRPAEVAPVFASLRELRDRLRAEFGAPDLVELSMGMSDDYREAIRQGATIVRLGRAIFGERS